jgi:hypothetical protein
MKAILTYAIYAAFGAMVANMALAETVIVDDKEFQLVEIDGQLLVSNEWEPVSEKGYTDEYVKSKQYQTAKKANEFIAKAYGRYDDE